MARVTRFFLITAMLVIASAAEAVQVNGFAYLTGQSNHANIQVVLDAVSPSAETDTAYTAADGAFSLSVEPGVYDVLYSHDGYAVYRLPDQILLWDTTLDPVTLMPPLSGYLSGTIGPGDFQVTDTLFVTDDDSLIVAPGTRLFFDGHQPFIVYGGLQAVGTESDSIVFSHRYETGPDSVWGGLVLWQADDIVQISYLTIEHGQGAENYPYYRDGGGLFCMGSILNADHSTLQYNSTTGIGGAAFIDGSTAIIENCYFYWNRDDYQCGGIAFIDADVTLRNCVVEGNSNDGIWASNTDALIESCSVIHNGGGVRLSGGSSIISRCVILTTNSSALRLYQVTDAHIERCMVYSNAPSHSGVVTISSSTAAINSCIVYSTVFCNAIYFAASSSSQVQFCNFFAPGGVAFRYQGDNPSHGPPAIGLIALTNANGDSCDTYYNLFMDPQFADTANGDYHLLAGSPCIDAGDPELSNDPDGTIADIGAFYYNQAGTADDVRTAVRHYELLQNYPNPFNNTTEIVFDLPRNEFVELSVYDIGGRRVMTLLAERMAAGRHAVNVDASALPSGVYLYQLRGEGFSETRKMVLIK